MKDLIDISNSEEVSKALQTAKILALGSPREIRKIMIERRDACHERGYHRVSKEKTEGTMICYD